jgi:SAM-dependent methyltransferase
MTTILPCPACGGERQETLEPIDLPTQHRHYAPANLEIQAQLTRAAARSTSCYQMVGCADCRLEFALPMHSPSADWYALAYSVLDLYPQMRWEFQACLERLRPDGSIFEFGCGTGAFLKLCQERGWPAQGMDFAPSAVEACQRQGLGAVQMEINDAVPAALEQSASELVAFHVVEHLAEPRKLFRQARQIALAGANLWLAVPSDRRASRHFRRRDFLDQPPHHLSRWSAEAFRELGAREGWQLLQVHYEPLSVASSLWHIATASGLYQWAQRHGGMEPGWRERSLRALLYPYAMARRLTADRGMTGFSMLAQFGLGKNSA